jgi:hypothetical protein
LIFLELMELTAFSIAKDTFLFINYYICGVNIKKQLHVVFTMSYYTTSKTTSIEHYMNIIIFFQVESFVDKQ